MCWSRCRALKDLGNFISVTKRLDGKRLTTAAYNIQTVHMGAGWGRGSEGGREGGKSLWVSLYTRG